MNKEYLYSLVDKTKEELIEDLEQYYESAGFKNPKGRGLDKLSLNELKDLYLEDVYKQEEDIPF